MRRRVRRRIDWDEEIRKTERIRRRGLFISTLGFGVATAFIVGASRMGSMGVDISRKLIFTFCFVAAMFLMRGVFRRRERLRREREEREDERLSAQIEQAKQSKQNKQNKNTYKNTYKKDLR